MLSPTALLQVLGALSPLQASCGKCGEPGQPQVLPQEGCKDKCSFEGTTMLWPAVALPTVLSFSQVPFPSPPIQPLCYRIRDSRSSPTCQCLSQSLSFLSQHGSTCQGHGQGTTAPKYGCGCLDGWKRAGWNDILQDSMMAFLERIIHNYPLFATQLRNAAAKAKICGLLEDGDTRGVVKFLAIALLAW